MTREEAIKIFNGLLLFGKAPCKKEELEDLCKVVLTALEQEPTTKNDLGVDCISRADAIRVASGYCHPSNVAKELAKLPSVTPQEPKTGHWIFVGEENKEETKAGNFRYVCSECGFSDVHGKSIYVPYCWQCGAKMAESERDHA